MIQFADRIEAGRQLAPRLSKLKKAIVIGIPRGGVEVAYALAKSLGCQLGVVISKKISAPGNPELAIGAISHGGAISLAEGFDSLAAYVDEESKRIASEIKRRMAMFGATLPAIKGKEVIIADDGMATGHTALAAVRAVEKLHPKKVVVAVPVSSRQAFELVKGHAEVVALDVPEFFMSVGEHYRSFPQLTDEDVIDYLK